MWFSTVHADLEFRHSDVADDQIGNSDPRRCGSDQATKGTKSTKMRERHLCFLCLVAKNSSVAILRNDECFYGFTTGGLPLRLRRCRNASGGDGENRQRGTSSFKLHRKGRE